MRTDNDYYGTGVFELNATFTCGCSLRLYLGLHGVFDMALGKNRRFTNYIKIYCIVQNRTKNDQQHQQWKTVW